MPRRRRSSGHPNRRQGPSPRAASTSQSCDPEALVASQIASRSGPEGTPAPPAPREGEPYGADRLAQRNSGPSSPRRYNPGSAPSGISHRGPRRPRVSGPTMGLRRARCSCGRGEQSWSPISGSYDCGNADKTRWRTPSWSLSGRSTARPARVSGLSSTPQPRSACHSRTWARTMRWDYAELTSGSAAKSELPLPIYHSVPWTMA